MREALQARGVHVELAVRVAAGRLDLEVLERAASKLHWPFGQLYQSRVPG
jgi:hypothetical protein